jgi:hypothetical protein
MNCFCSLIIAITFTITSYIFPSDSISLTSHQQHAQQWADNLTHNLTPTEIQLTANIVYLLHTNALIDMKIRQFVIPITKLNQAIRSNIINYKNTANELAILKTLLERLSHIIGARTIYNQKLQTGLTYYNKNNNGQLTTYLENLQLYGQQALNDYAESNRAEMSQKLLSSAEILEAHVPTLQAIANLHKGLAENSFLDYFKNNDATKNIIALATLDELLNNNMVATKNAENVLNTLDASTEYALKLISSANDIYKQHYAALYAHISSDKFDQTYAVTLFGMNDILPDEYKSLLPHPDHIFEHVLQTIKLYTKIEITQ